MISRFDELVLLKICRKTSLSLPNHMPAEAFKRSFPGREERAQDSLEKLIKLGYVLMHPTRGGMTYQIRRAGRDLCKTLKVKGL